MATEQELREYIRSNPPTGEFKPKPFYFETGDFISFRWEQGDHYATRVSELLTLYRSMKTKKPVGITIKSVRNLILQRMSEFFGSTMPVNPTIGMLLVVSIAFSERRDETTIKQAIFELGEKTRDIPIEIPRADFQLAG